MCLNEWDSQLSDGVDASYVTPPSLSFNVWLLCNAMIQPFFDYVCNASYPNLNKNLKRVYKLLKINALDFA